MKVLAINGSPRKNGNTYLLLKEMEKIFKNREIEWELVSLAEEKINPCLACGKCKQNKNLKCIQTDDCINELLEKIVKADALLLASPTYFADVTAPMKALIDRCGYVLRANGNPLKRKVGAGVVAVRRGGANRVFDTFNHFFLINEMFVAGSTYWNFAFGGGIGEVLNDAEGLKTIRDLAENMAWFLERIQVEK